MSCPQRSQGDETPTRVAVLALAVVPYGVTAQVIRLGSDNRRTIDIISTGKVSLVADSAEVKLGFTNTVIYGITQ